MKIIIILLLIITHQALAEDEYSDKEFRAFSCDMYGEQARIILSDRYEGKSEEEQIIDYAEDKSFDYEGEEWILNANLLTGIVNAAHEEKLVKSKTFILPLIFNQRKKLHLNKFEKKQASGCRLFFEDEYRFSDVVFCGEYGKEARNALDRRYRGATLAEVLQSYDEKEFCMTEDWNFQDNCLTKEALIFNAKRAYEQYLTISYVAKEKNRFENWAIKSCLSDMEEYDTNPDSDSRGLSMEQCNSWIEFAGKTIDEAISGVGISDYLNSYEGELTKELTEGILQVYKSVNAMIIEKGNITEHDKRIINALMENSLIECYEDAMD